MFLSSSQWGPTPAITITAATRPRTARRENTMRVASFRQRPVTNGCTAPAAMIARPTQRPSGPSSPRTHVTRWSSGIVETPLTVIGTKNMNTPIAE